MLVLGLNGSPRKKGNTRFLLSSFLQTAGDLGAQTRMLNVAEMNIVPCKELVVCEKKGYCPIDDDMKHVVYPLLRRAEVILAASPVFFYNVTAQLKAVIDRSQTLWARKYRLKLVDPAGPRRRGLLLAVGATQGRNLFEGMKLTAQYFFDAVEADYVDSLTYRRIEGPKDMQQHPTVQADVGAAVRRHVAPLLNRKKILFTCRDNACLSQMAAAFAQYRGGDRFDVACGGREPAERIEADMQAAMAEKGIDMAFREPVAVAAAVDGWQPELTVSIGSRDDGPDDAGATHRHWDLADPSGGAPERMRRVRDDIEKRVEALMQDLG